MRKASRLSKIAEPVTQKDIAHMAGVSSTVVSYVINEGPRPVAEETKQRVLRAIAQLGYRPNKNAQRLKTKTEHAHKQLGIILGGGSNVLKRPYYGDMLAGIYEEAYRQGQHIRFLHFFEELHDPLLFNEYVHPGEISALILFPLCIAFQLPENEALLQRICRQIKNIVCLEKSVGDLPAVVFDRVGAARTAVTHLIAFGHCQIGFVGNKGDRIQGYRQALLEHNLAYDDRLVIHPGSKNSTEEGYAGTQHLLQQDPRPTAIFAICDEVALGVMGALHDQHIKVPDEMAVVSVDDMDFAAMVRPALTTVQIPRWQMGVHALRILAMHEAYPDTHPASTVLRTELIVRQSCGAMARTNNFLDAHP
jgi:DNA-binding LacI/PurR family transcriptional regulator